MKRKSIVLALCLMLLMVLAGCGKEVAVEEPTPPTSEVVSEVVLEEVSEPVSEELSEEVVNEATIDIAQYTSANSKRPVDLLDDMDFDEPKIIVWGYFDDEEHGAKVILSDGESGKMKQGDVIYLFYPQANLEVGTSVDYIDFSPNEKYCSVYLNTEESNIEIPITATATDGTVYEITVNLTVE